MIYEIGLKFNIIYGAAAVTPTWTTTLPQSLLHKGFEITKAPNIARTKVEAGPVFQRPRYSVDIDEIKGILLVDSTQLETFWTFYSTILGGGALRFNWKHPITGDDAICQFDGSEPPSVKSV